MRAIKVNGKIKGDGKSTVTLVSDNGSPVEVDPHSVLTNALRIGHVMDLLDGNDKAFDYQFPLTL